MPASHETATNEIMSAFKTKWDADAPAIHGGAALDPFWDGVGTRPEPDPAKTWLEVVIRHASGGQASLSDAAGKRKFARLGIVTVAIYFPLGQEGGLVKGKRLAQVARAAFEGKATASGVWFRNARIVEVGIDRAWYHFNVIAEFRYHEYV